VAERALEDFEAIGLLERAGGADASRWTETTDQREKPWRVTRDRDLLVRVLGVE
jgi:hypothetical protein